MSTMNPLAELVLAYETPDGRKLARFGQQNYRIPLVPPNTPILFQVLPLGGAYCNIYFANRWSPAIVPNTIYFETSHRGVLWHSTVLGSMAIAEPHNIWVEVTEKDYFSTQFTNISPVNQYYASYDLFLVVQSEYDLQEIRKLVNEYSNSKTVELLQETNDLLTNGFSSLGGSNLAPRPSL